MYLEPFRDTVQFALRNKTSIAPFLLVNIILIGLLSYGLIQSNNMSDDEKKTHSYVEIALALVGSFPVLILFGVFTIVTLVGFIIRRVSSNRLLLFLFYGLIFIILNPVSLTALRILLHDTLNDQQQNIIAGITIPLTLLISYLTVLVFNGFFMH